MKKIGYVFFVVVLLVCQAKSVEYNMNGTNSISLPAGYNAFFVDLRLGGQSAEIIHHYFGTETKYVSGYGYINVTVPFDSAGVDYSIYGFSTPLIINVDGFDPVEQQVYDFSSDIHEYNQVEPAIAVLEYMDSSSNWVQVAGVYIPGKDSVLDPPIPYQFGSYELEEGITEWRQGFIFGENPELEALIPDYGNNYDCVGLTPNQDGQIFINDVQLTGDIGNPSTYVPSGSPGGVTVVYGTSDDTDNASGIGNVVGSNNDSVNSALEVAAGIHLAKSDIADGTKQGVADMKAGIEGKLGDVIDAIYEAGTAETEQGDPLGNITESTFGTNDFENSFTNTLSDASDVADDTIGFIEQWFGSFFSLTMPTSFGQQYAMTFNLAGSAPDASAGNMGTLTVDVSSWSSLSLIRALEAWLLHIYCVFLIVRIYRNAW